jgi:hypothetical protein
VDSRIGVEVDADADADADVDCEGEETIEFDGEMVLREREADLVVGMAGVRRLAVDSLLVVLVVCRCALCRRS